MEKYESSCLLDVIVLEAKAMLRACKDQRLAIGRNTSPILNCDGFTTKRLYEVLLSSTEREN